MSTMPSEPKRPLSLLLCSWAVGVAARLIPAEQRAEWQREWLAELWHRWLFLLHAGLWNKAEAAKLIGNCAGAFADAAWHFTSQDRVQSRVREVIRSPWSCLGAGAVALLLVAGVSGGLPAARGLPGYGADRAGGRLLFVWAHPSSGGGDKGLPAEVVPVWGRKSSLVSGVAGFKTTRETVTAGTKISRLLVVRTQPELFHVLETQPRMGRVPSEGAVAISYRLWKTRFGGDPRAVGRFVEFGGKRYRVSAVLPAAFQFLSRQPVLYLMERPGALEPLMVVVRARRGVTEARLDDNFTKIAETDCYYFFKGQLRYQSLEEEAWLPLRMFGVAALASALLLFLVSRSKIAHWKAALHTRSRSAWARRTGFMAAKSALGLAVVFLAGLEWSRSTSAIVMGSRDPAAGPLLLWLYILGSMGVLFWALADQRARCRVCLRLLCFPVRIGCPGCLLLEWSGTELLCTEGHGVLHVPHMAASWEDETDRWIALDDSWKDLFAAEAK